MLNTVNLINVNKLIAIFSQPLLILPAKQGTYLQK